VKTSSISLILNIILNLILMFPLKVSGLALATAISASFNFLLLYRELKKKVKDLETKKIIDSLIRIFLASLFMGIFLWISFYKFCSFLRDSLLRLLFGIILGIIFYILFCFLFRVEELSQAKRWILKKR